ncbi:hypothetical protein HOLleu_23928 [Holothuria leucospilota]|uniref:Uncharacterized protein n=1 Tax=Holothuria leucospilota TaxID=206669 RepID=A0A9Q1BVW3_HOLLE|nr:hypothetical protein HOLleu_23928 [Holothuria leucospilota]
MWTDGRSSYFKQCNIMHSTTKDKQIDSITEEVKQIDYSVFGMTSERTENKTNYTVVAGKVTTTDETFASTHTNGTE